MSIIPNSRDPANLYVVVRKYISFSLMVILNWFKKNYNVKFIYPHISCQLHNILLYETEFAFLTSTEQKHGTEFWGSYFYWLKSEQYYNTFIFSNMDYVFDQCGNISKQLECMDIWRLQGICECWYDSLPEYGTSLVSLDLPLEFNVIGTELHVIHIILIKTTQTCFWEGSFRKLYSNILYK